MLRNVNGVYIEGITAENPAFHKIATYDANNADGIELVNQAMTVEPADKPAEFYNIDAFRITADTITKNTIDIVADVDDQMPYKPVHSHHDLYFQDITFTNIDTKLAKNSEILQGASNVTFNNVVINWKNIEKGSDDAAAESYQAWANISACSNLNFIGTITQSVNSYDAMSKPVWPEDAAVLASASEATKSGSERKVTLKWPAAIDGDQVAGKGEIAGYIVETYLEDELINITKPVSGTSCEIGGLSQDTCYLFKVYVVDQTGNRTPELAYAVTATEREDLELVEPESNQENVF